MADEAGVLLEGGHHGLGNLNRATLIRRRNPVLRSVVLREEGLLETGVGGVLHRLENLRQLVLRRTETTVIGTAVPSAVLLRRTPVGTYGLEVHLVVLTRTTAVVTVGVLRPLVVVGLEEEELLVGLVVLTIPELRVTRLLGRTLPESYTVRRSVVNQLLCRLQCELGPLLGVSLTQTRALQIGLGQHSQSGLLRHTTTVGTLAQRQVLNGKLQVADNLVVEFGLRAANRVVVRTRNRRGLRAQYDTAPLLHDVPVRPTTQEVNLGQLGVQLGLRAVALHRRCIVDSRVTVVNRGVETVPQHLKRSHIGAHVAVVARETNLLAFAIP